jgi:RNA polymerase sigma-70 factor (ECF subfamily)
MSALSIDCALVTRTQAGDEEATSELAAQVRPLAQRYASRFFTDPARAEDLAQTAMMKAFARVRDVRTPEAFQGWLLRITRNECLNELARQRVAQVPISTLEDQGTALEAPAGGEDDPEESFVRLQLQSLVRQVITTLPSHYRQTLTMRALEDRGYEEISEELGVPIAVARLWYCRARKRFRHAFVAAMVSRRNVPAACQAMGGDIAEMIEGTLTRAERDRVQGHLADCHVCRQTEDELRSTAFRAPSRALLLGLGLLDVPRRLAGNVSRAVRTAHVSTRMVLGTMGTATAVVVAGAPGGLTSDVFAASLSPSAGPNLATGVAGASATGALGGGAGFVGAGDLGVAAPAGSAGLAAAATGLVGSLDGFVDAVASIDLGRTLSLAFPVSLPSRSALVRHAVRGARPLLDAVIAETDAASAQASSTASQGQSSAGSSSSQAPSSNQQAPSAPTSAGAPGAPAAPALPPSPGVPGGIVPGSI